MDKVIPKHRRSIARLETTEKQDMVVLASIAVKKIPSHNSKQSYAYLRFKVKNTTITKYVGQVSSENMEESLKLGWKLARARKVAELHGWRWVVE